MKHLGLSLVVLAVAACGCSSPTAGPTVAESVRERTGFTVPVRSPTNGWDLPPQVVLDDGLSEDEAVTIALWNNAGFRAALAELGIARADLIEAGQLANPTLSLLFPLGPKQMEFAATLPVQVLWQRPRRVALARVNERKVAEQLVQNGLDLIRDVRVAFADVVLAQDRERLAREAAVAQTQIAEIAKARVQAGDASELESSTAQVAALRARDESRAASHELVLSRQRLAVLLGSPARQHEFRGVATEPRQTSVPGRQRLIEMAITSRPDLRASELELEAAGKRAGLTTAELFSLSAILDANEKESGGGFDLGPGVELPIPILHQNQGARARARAEVARSAWRLAATRQQIEADVTAARTQLLQNREALQSWREEVLPPLNDAVDQTSRAYEAGEVSLLAVHEVTRARVAGRLREAELIAAVRRAHAELARGIGRQIEP